MDRSGGDGLSAAAPGVTSGAAAAAAAVEVDSQPIVKRLRKRKKKVNYNFDHVFDFGDRQERRLVAAGKVPLSPAVDLI